MKFGGTSVQDAAAIRRLCQLVARPSAQRPVVVVSALAKVTDQLMNAGTAAAAGQLDSAREILQLLQQRHETVASGLVKNEDRRRLFHEFADEFEALDNALLRIVSEKAMTPCTQDSVLGVGEALSAKLVQAALRSAGVNSVLVDSRECVVTDAAHTQATPLWDETNRRLQAVVVPLLESGQVPVMGGFVGSTRDGIPTTLGRGGSDFSASIIGAGVGAQRIEIWTDVDGVMTTDPNLCPDALRVPRMSFDEAADLAYFGAKVLHPATLAPAMRGNIPVWVRNSRNPDCPGTEIVAHCEGDGVKAITVKRSVAIVDVEPVRWFAPELVREVFDVFERHQHSLDLLSASRGSLALLVNSVSGTAGDRRRVEGNGQRPLGKPQSTGLPGGGTGPAASRTGQPGVSRRRRYRCAHDLPGRFGAKHQLPGGRVSRRRSGAAPAPCVFLATGTGCVLQTIVDGHVPGRSRMAWSRLMSWCRADTVVRRL